MQEDQERQDKIDVNHEKNLKEAEKQAREMLASAKDESMQLAEEKLQSIATQSDSVESAPVEEESHGFLGKFKSNMNEVINGEELARQEAEKAK